MSSGRKCKFYSIGALRALVNAPINETQSTESNVITKLRPSTCPTRKWRRKEKTRERLYNFLLFIKILRFIRGLSWHLIKKKFASLFLREVVFLHFPLISLSYLHFPSLSFSFFSPFSPYLSLFRISLKARRFLLSAIRFSTAIYDRRLLIVGRIISSRFLCVKR